MSLLVHFIIFISIRCVHINFKFRKHDYQKNSQMDSMKVLVVRHFIILLNHTITFTERLTY
jgi:hypothetical protein